MRAVSPFTRIALPSLALSLVAPVGEVEAKKRRTSSGGPPAWVEACRVRLEHARDDAAKAGIPVGGVKASVREARIGKETIYSAALDLVIGLVEATTSSRAPTAWNETSSDGTKRGFRDGAGRSVQYSLPPGDPDWTKLVAFVKPALDDCLVTKGAR